MTNKKTSKSIRSPESRERMRAAARVRHDGNAEQIHVRVRAVMQAIQQEMAANKGVYPHNGGAVPLAEVARRARIHPFTFYKKRYVLLADEVREWRKTLESGAVVGRMRVRKELGTRLQEWKELYEDLRETHRISETDLARAEAKLRELQDDNAKLRQRLADLTKKKVVKLRPESE
ncbi:hypothetical protein [Ralstonia pseudosolanacearum]|uniref:hypothetical protein n=1 Tax=Ralstonia pseudosolanacearum TaxID=1310165 RepID=UPI003CED9B1E